ncbi:MAG: NUDIX domain-containing protein [Anaerolineales bacterium]|jgi:8-oxo-dGTP pyrophosphatase MutT (NUDIX family)
MIIQSDIISDHFAEIVRTHLSRYPQAQIEDLYKLSHQAALGSEHAVEDEGAARAWLKRELDQIEGNSTEALIDEISGDGGIVRVHLRPYKDMGSSPESLLRAFIATANHFNGSQEELRVNWDIIERLAQNGEIHLPYEGLRAFMEKMQSSGYPAVHHSDIYQLAYKPSYRVISRQTINLLVPPPTQKVTAYITHGGRLLVFSHIHHPKAGIQVPAGTVAPGESLQEAVLRECREETGLDELEITRYLGAKSYDLADYGLQGVEWRCYFHLECLQKTPETWHHLEMDPSDGSPGPIEFEFFWISFQEGVPKLSGNLGNMLEKISPERGGSLLQRP